MHQVQEAHLAILVAAVAERSRDHGHRSHTPAEEASEQRAGRAPRGAIVDAHVRHAAGVREVGDQRDHVHSALGERIHGFTDDRMLEGHECHALRTPAMAQEGRGDSRGIEAIDEVGAAAHVEWR